MSGFTVDWLNLRELADSRARNKDLLAVLRCWSQHFDHISAIDIASGTGSCIRALAPYLGLGQSWRLMDHSDSLLAAAKTNLCKWGQQNGLQTKIAPDRLEIYGDDKDYELTFHDCDLSRGFGDRPSEIDLVTVSAFLDLVSASWCMKFVDWCSETQACVYACLNYNGCVTFGPAHPTDSLVLDALNYDQRRDKGFGEGLGSRAVSVLECALRHAGYDVITAPSAWALGKADLDLQTALIKDWMGLVDKSQETRDWLKFRLTAIEQCHSQLDVGHTDLWAWPISW